MTLMDKLITARESDEHIITIFSEFSKAFDTVYPEILLPHYHYGTRGKIFEWF